MLETWKRFGYDLQCALFGEMRILFQFSRRTPRYYATKITTLAPNERLDTMRLRHITTKNKQLWQNVIVSEWEIIHLNVNPKFAISDFTLYSTVYPRSILFEYLASEAVCTAFFSSTFTVGNVNHIFSRSPNLRNGLHWKGSGPSPQGAVLPS